VIGVIVVMAVLADVVMRNDKRSLKKKS